MARWKPMSAALVQKRPCLARNSPVHHTIHWYYPLLAAFLLSSAGIFAEELPQPEAAAPGFLEIARDPDAPDEQKRTIAAMMAFVNETDIEAAFEKLEATDVLTIYGGGAESVSDLTPLSGLTNLETLVLYNNEISDLQPLASLVNLRTLRLELNRIEDIGPLAKLHKLESLQITNNRIADLGPLSGLSQLRTLWLSDNRIEDISPLGELASLRNLYLSGNRVTDLGIFAELALCDLRLAGNGIEDISALRRMNQETTCFINLDLSDNAIRDITPIGELERLSSLNLSNNRIEDARGLRNPELRYLDLEGNKLARIPDLAVLELNAIKLGGNPISDFEELIAYKKKNPLVDIQAGEAFVRAYEDSIPMVEELEGSPILGTWRTEPLDTEWGFLIVEMRFLPNGIFHQTLLPGEPDDEMDAGEGYSMDGRFAIREGTLEFTMGGEPKENAFEIDDDVLRLVDNESEVTLKRIAD